MKSLIALMILFSAGTASADWAREFNCWHASTLIAVQENPSLEILEIKKSCIVEKCNRILPRLQKAYLNSRNGNSLFRHDVAEERFRAKERQCNIEYLDINSKINSANKNGAQ